MLLCGADGFDSGMKPFILCSVVVASVLCWVAFEIRALRLSLPGVVRQFDRTAIDARVSGSVTVDRVWGDVKLQRD